MEMLKINMFYRSDSEYESVVSLPHTSKSKTAVAAPNKRKNNSAEPQRYVLISLFYYKIRYMIPNFT